MPARLITRLAAAPPSEIVPWHALLEALYHEGEEPPDDGGRGVLAVAACRARKALRDAGARVGIATTKGGPTATGGEGGMRLDRDAAGGAVVHQRRDYRHLLAAHAEGVSSPHLAERFGYANAGSARNTVSRARRRLRAEAASARDAGGAG